MQRPKRTNPNAAWNSQRTLLEPSDLDRRITNPFDLANSDFFSVRKARPWGEPKARLVGDSLGIEGSVPAGCGHVSARWYFLWRATLNGFIGRVAIRSELRARRSRGRKRQVTRQLRQAAPGKRSPAVRFPDCLSRWFPRKLARSRPRMAGCVPPVSIPVVVFNSNLERPLESHFLSTGRVALLPHRYCRSLQCCNIWEHTSRQH